MEGHPLCCEHRDILEVPQKWMAGHLEGDHGSGSSQILRQQKFHFFSELGRDRALRNWLKLPKVLGD